jgi:hypothetical protein
MSIHLGKLEVSIISILLKVRSVCQQKPKLLDVSSIS